MKACSKCKEIKEMEMFSRSKKMKDGRKSACKACAKKSNDEYRSNPDVIKREAEYNLSRADVKKKYMRKRYSENREKLKAKQRKWSSENKEQMREAGIIYRENNKEMLSARKKIYRANNLDKMKMKDKLYNATQAGIERKYRADEKRKKQILETRDGSITKQSLIDLMEEQNGLCYICSCDLSLLENKDVHLDHMKPLSKDGHHVITNVAWSCSSCNWSKATKILS